MKPLNTMERKELNNLRHMHKEDMSMIKIMNLALRNYIFMTAHGLGCDSGSQSKIYENHPKGSFHFIPYSPQPFLQGLLQLNEKGFFRGPKKKFLDAGCGIGNQVLLARSTYIFSECCGIEINRSLVKKGQKLLADKTAIRQADILTYRSYHKFDVIYFWVPIIDYRLQQQFEERLEDKMKVGALLLAMGKRSHRIVKDKRFIQIRLNSSFFPFTVFKKIKA